MGNIKKEYIKNLDINDPIFTSLKEDYFEFEKWLKIKANNNQEAFVTYNDSKLGSLLILKIEDESEKYLSFDKPFEKGKRLKISTFKVQDNGKNIGAKFLDIIKEEARKNNVQEIYITLFEDKKNLIKLLKENGFEFFTTKKTKDANGEIKTENVMIYRMEN